MRRILAGTLLLGGVACATEAVDAPAADSGRCPVVFAGEWRAWVDAEPPGPRILHISGQITAPTPGYSISWRFGATDRANPPGQHVHLEVTPPSGMVAQVITTEDVHYSGEAAYPEYRSIHVHCGDYARMEITPVPVAY